MLGSRLGGEDCALTSLYVRKQPTVCKSERPQEDPQSWAPAIKIFCDTDNQQQLEHDSYLTTTTLVSLGTLDYNTRRVEEGNPTK